MMKSKEFIELKLDGSVKILDHPNQSEIYSSDIDEDFKNNIKLHGVAIAPIVSINNGLIETEPEDAIVIISGHQRIKVCQELGFESIQCELRHFESMHDADFLHLISNKQRKKKRSEIAAEIKVYNQKLCQVRKLLQSKGSKAIEEVKKITSVKLSRDGIVDENFKLNAYEVIEMHLGVSEDQQKYHNAVLTEEWYEEKNEKIGASSLSKSKKSKLSKAFHEFWESVRKEADSEKLSMYRAYRKINDEWNRIAGMIDPKSKKPKRKKPKKSTTKVWIKPKDFAQIATDENVNKADVRFVNWEQPIVATSEGGKEYLIDIEKLLKYLKEQGI